MDWKRHVWSNKGTYYETSTSDGYVRIYNRSQNNWQIRFSNGEYMVGHHDSLKEAKSRCSRY